MSEWWDKEETAPREETKEIKPLSDTPSSEAVPHWAEPKPVWSMSEDEFWRSQVAGRLALMWERAHRVKIRFVPRPNVATDNGLIAGMELQDWINGARELATWTREQITFAEGEVRKMRSEGSLPKSYGEFKRSSIDAAIGWMEKNPKKALPAPMIPPDTSFKALRSLREARKDAPPPPKFPKDDCPF